MSTVNFSCKQKLQIDFPSLYIIFLAKKIVIIYYCCLQLFFWLIGNGNIIWYQMSLKDGNGKQFRYREVTFFVGLHQ
jgi:hypothetical protein